MNDVLMKNVLQPHLILYGVICYTNLKSKSELLSRIGSGNLRSISLRGENINKLVLNPL